VIPFREDKDMLYISLTSSKGSQAGVFVRNSGTENKISVNLRGAKSDTSALKTIGEQAVRILFATLKDQKSHHYKVERDLLSRMAVRPLKETQVTGSAQQVLREMAKQKLVRPSARGWRLTSLGTWYITNALK
jgi:hypothetical protein